MNAQKRVITGAVFGGVIALIMGLGIKWPLLTALFFVGVLFLCVFEYHHAMKKRFKNLSLTLSLISGAMVITPFIAWLAYRGLRPGWHLITIKGPFLDEYWSTDQVWLTFMALGCFMVISGIFILGTVTFNLLKRGPESLPTTFINVTPIFYLAFPFSFAIVYLFGVANGWRWLLFALITPWISDIAGYYVGTNYGRRKILPKLSPNKSLEGVAGGIAGAALFGILYFLIFMSGMPPLRSGAGVVILFGFLSGAILSLVSQLGDWMGSGIKRLTGCKDFSQLLPGHGGILDRFDSVLFSLPISFLICVCYSFWR